MKAERQWEAALLAVALLDAFVWPWSLVTMVVAALLLLLHCRRFVLVPLYCSLALGLLHSLTSPDTAFWPGSSVTSTSTTNSFFRGFLVVLAAFLSLLVFPLPNFGELSGSHQRVGVLAQVLGGVSIRIFYPASIKKSGGGQRSPYLHFGLHTPIGLAEYARLPTLLFRTMTAASNRALLHAPIAMPTAGAGFPVVIFSHGLGGTFELYSSIAEDWVSHGFVVVCINHSDGSAAVSGHRLDAPLTYYERPPEDWMPTRKKQLQHRVREVSQVIAALDVLGSQPSTSMFYRKLDMQKLVLSGHSFGGASAIEAATAAANRGKVKAVVVHDFYPEVLDEVHAIHVPFLHIAGEGFSRVYQQQFQRFAEACTDDLSQTWKAGGSEHMNFSDIPAFSPNASRMMGKAGRTPPARSLAMISQLSIAFIEAALAKPPHRNDARLEAVQQAFPELVRIH